VHVVRDCVAELGVEDGEQFRSLSELHLPHDGSGPAPWLWLENTAPPASAALAALPAATGITVNTVHGSERSIAAVQTRLHPQVESMEGGAFMYACAVAGVPFAQVRAVSNRVEPRNRADWKLTEAVAALSARAYDILETL
jgi:futalosine hydrolase